MKLALLTNGSYVWQKSVKLKRTQCHNVVFSVSVKHFVNVVTKWKLEKCQRDRSSKSHGKKHGNCLRERVYFMVQSLQSTQPHAQGGEGGPHLPGPASALGPDVIRGLETHPIQGFHWARRVMMSSSISKGSTMEAYLRKG